MRTISTEEIEVILSNIRNGNKITRKDRIFHQNIEGTLNDKVLFVYTNDEISEYVKCASDIKYFISKYTNIVLRKYQEEWIDSFNENRFNIIMNARQTGSDTILTLICLHYCIFNADKKIVIRSHNKYSNENFIKEFFNFYLRIPYFLKPKIVNKNTSSIIFNNGTSIKNLSIVEKIDFLLYIDFAFISTVDKKFTSDFASVSALADSRIIIQSCPNGMNDFMHLVQNSERKKGDPKKNLFKTIRTYWWEVPGRDDAWRLSTINDIGSEASFNQEYDLQFIKKKN